MSYTTKNLWIQTEYPAATWVADLSPARAMPDALADFGHSILASGLEQCVFEPTEAPAMGYARNDGDFTGRWAAVYRGRSVLELFSFTGAAMAPGAPGSSSVRAWMAWFDMNGKPTEDWCEDLGALLRTLEPVPGSIPNGFTQSFPPMRIMGPRLDYSASKAEPLGLRTGRALKVRFSIHSDIWLPWVFGSAHPECDHIRMFDNRELATRHTPRLNRFIAHAAAATADIGGTWSIARDEVAKYALPWIGDEGIALDKAPDLENRMPAEALEAAWF